MNIDYLKERFERAKAMNADVVKIDIEEFASLLEWIDTVFQQLCGGSMNEQA